MLDCTPLPGNPPNTSVTFTVDGSGLNLRDPSVSVSNFVLTISNIQRRHRGTYSCEAFNGFGTNPNVRISVDVVCKYACAPGSSTTICNPMYSHGLSCVCDSDYCEVMSMSIFADIQCQWLYTYFYTYKFNHKIRTMYSYIVLKY